MYTARGACGFSLGCGAGFQESPFISFNTFLLQRWFSGRLQMDRHLRTPDDVPTQCSSDAKLLPSHRPRLLRSSNFGMSAAFWGSLKCTTSANSATCPWYGRPRSLSYGVFPSDFTWWCGICYAQCRTRNGNILWSKPTDFPKFSLDWDLNVLICFSTS